MKVSVTINGIRHTHDLEPRMSLVHFLRDILNLTGTHIGCDTSGCGACTVLLNGRAIKSCTILAIQTDGKEITTIEGMAPNGQMHTIQEAFRENHGLQCGFCTPGMVMTAADILKTNPTPSEKEIREGLKGNFCRCTGYHNIVKSIQHAAETLNQ
jgi:carbon-monoxide dehydrogenase small subunit